MKGAGLCLILLAVCQMTTLLAQKSQVARDAYEEALGAPDRSSQIIALKVFIDQFCALNNQSYECAQAVRRYELLTGAYFRDLMSSCDTSNSITNKINCLQDAQKEYSTGPMGELVMNELSRIEDVYWSSLDADPTAWNIDDFQEYLSLLPNGKYFQRAQDKIEFLAAASSLDTEVFFKRHVSGRGDDRLAYFSSQYADHVLAQLAREEVNRTEETLWTDVTRKGTVQAYERYLRWYPQGRFVNEALTMIRNGSAPIAPILTADELNWQNIKNTSEPEVLRNFIKNYSESRFVEDAEKQLIALDDQLWTDVQSLGSLAAYQRYLQIFPDGAFVGDARSRLSTSSNEGEDVYWASIMKSPSIKNLQAYLAQYPAGKYRIEVIRTLQKLRAAEYHIENRNGVFLIQFFNASNLAVVKTNDTLFIDDTQLKSENILEVSIKESGRFSIVLEDENGKEIVVDLSRIIYIEDFINAADSVIVYVVGGSEPYTINFQDTAMDAQLRIFELEEEFNEGLISLAKSSLLDLCGRGTFQVVLKDKRREQVEIAGIVLLQPSQRKVILYVSLILAVLTVIGIAWVSVYRRLNRKKSVFDEMDYEEEWDELQ